MLNRLAELSSVMPPSASVRECHPSGRPTHLIGKAYDGDEEARVNRWLSAGVLVALIGSAGCGSTAERSEVRTNSGGELDCPSDNVWYFFITPSPDGGAPTPGDALAQLTGDLRPPGAPQVESETSGEFIYVFVDPEGNRLGRVLIGQPDDSYWSALQTERCG